MNDIKVTQGEEYGSMIVDIPLGLLVGLQAGPLRQSGANIPDDVPDCAVLQAADDEGSTFTWITATVTLGGNDG